jgi:hypothetical protein
MRCRDGRGKAGAAAERIVWHAHEKQELSVWYVIEVLQ